MKEIDESFFKQELKKKTVEEQLDKGEKILWKGCPKRSSYAMNQSIGLMPIALLWGAIDIGIILGAIIPSASEMGGMLFFLVPFFALHMFPVWLWLAQLIKSAKYLKGIRYVITNKRILEFKKNYGYIGTSIAIKDLSAVSIKRSFIDKLLGVGDIYLTAKTGSLVLFDIPKSEFIFGKLREMCEIKRKDGESVMFYEEHNECLHCGSFFSKEATKCPNCGAPLKKGKEK